MASQSEDVLQIVSAVWHKKSCGSLYLMGERIAWMADSKSVFQISHNYIDIKTQKISPDSKEKVQLQLIMHNGEANTFHFRNTSGREACVADREKVKELLQTLLPQFRSKINSELERKHKMLQENKQLYQLYNDLVVCGVISAEEFWTNRTQLANDNVLKQNIGVSAAFLSEIKPQSAGANSLSYNLTSDMMECIFRTYPQVKKKHLECVPTEMTESEFWTKFFQSHYFHRDRVTLGGKDLFTDCAKQDEKEMEDAITSVPNRDEMIDLNASSEHMLSEGYNLSTEKSAVTSANQAIIKRFNHHSTRVLETAEHGTSLLLTNGTPAIPEEMPNKKRRKMEEMTELEDLQCPPEASTKSNLQLSKVDRYYNGPVPQTTQVKYRSSEDMLHAANLLVHEVEQWTDQTKCTLASSVAREILTELSPGGILMQGASQQPIADMVPVDIKTELKHLYCALNELLRHFWACFPPKTKQLEDKLVKMDQNLARFKQTKMQPFKEKIQPYSFSFNLTDHIETQLQTASEKYQKWYSKKMHKSSSTPALNAMAR